MQELDVLQKIDPPAFKVVMHLRSRDEEVPVNVQIYGVCTVQTGIVVDDMTS